ncbi:hypothetical protein MNBD_GAMMA12-423 [hydrothermal vent metagenome]|uniref:DUF1415 domain-containing protein n=1 Tax=hydrothermal vent metagenome TaxID=652676 RepID=A0A3B0YSY6_9ZZZZ
MTSDQDIIQSVIHWVSTIVIGLNLCPFAKREINRKSVRYQVSQARSDEPLLIDLKAELETIAENPNIETTLLILPLCLDDFYEYNCFLNHADALLQQLNLIGVIQIASFHPKYHFADTNINDVENYTNRSPYPILHLLREESLTTAIDRYPEVLQIPENNIALLRKMGVTKIKALIAQKPCLKQ